MDASTRLPADVTALTPEELRLVVAALLAYHGLAVNRIRADEDLPDAFEIVGADRSVAATVAG